MGVSSAARERNHGKPVGIRRCPRNGEASAGPHHATAAKAVGRPRNQEVLASPETAPFAPGEGSSQALRTKPCGLRGRSPLA